MPSEFIERQKNDLIRDISAFGSLFACILFALIFFLEKDYQMFTKIVFGFIIIYVVVIAIRSVHFKERPKKLSHTNIFSKLDASAFPSLHAARSTFLGFILVDFFNNRIISIILAILVIFIAYSRIYLQKHDFKDVLGGVGLGVLVYIFTTFLSPF